MGEAGWDICFIYSLRILQCGMLPTAYCLLRTMFTSFGLQIHHDVQGNGTVFSMTKTATISARSQDGRAAKPPHLPLWLYNYSFYRVLLAFFGTLILREAAK
jgi:hypothetical protein